MGSPTSGLINEVDDLRSKHIFNNIKICRSALVLNFDTDALIYIKDLEEVKAMSMEDPASEQDFQPLCESSRLSIPSPRVSIVSTPGLPSSPLPPMSPRTPRTPDLISESSSPFFLERNIDQVCNFPFN